MTFRSLVRVSGLSLSGSRKLSGFPEIFPGVYEIGLLYRNFQGFQGFSGVFRVFWEFLGFLREFLGFFWEFLGIDGII